MPRNMSFMLTTEQVKNKTKTVTRRLGWKNLKKGDILNACVKCMGLKKGEKPAKLGLIRVVDVRQEMLLDMMRYNYGRVEAYMEGFENMRGSEFVQMFCETMKCKPETEVTRIEFEYIN